eukprot:5421694-Prymnesium_polylepis.1
MIRDDAARHTAMCAAGLRSTSWGTRCQRSVLWQCSPTGTPLNLSREKGCAEVWARTGKKERRAGPGVFP